jgi:hypothetical protein
MGKPKKINELNIVFNGKDNSVPVYQTTKNNRVIYRLYMPFLYSVYYLAKTIQEKFKMLSFVSYDKRIVDLAKKTVEWEVWLQRGLSWDGYSSKQIQHVIQEVIDADGLRDSANILPNEIKLPITGKKMTFLPTNDRVVVYAFKTLKTDIPLVQKYLDENKDSVFLSYKFEFSISSSLYQQVNMTFDKAVAEDYLKTFFDGLDKTFASGSVQKAQPAAQPAPQKQNKILLPRTGLEAVQSSEAVNVYEIIVPSDTIANDIVKILRSTEDVYNFDVIGQINLPENDSFDLIGLRFNDESMIMLCLDNLDIVLSAKTGIDKTKNQPSELDILKMKFDNIKAGDKISFVNSDASKVDYYVALSDNKDGSIRVLYENTQAIGITTWGTVEGLINKGNKVNIYPKVTLDDLKNLQAGDKVTLTKYQTGEKDTVKEKSFVVFKRGEVNDKNGFFVDLTTKFLDDDGQEEILKVENVLYSDEMLEEWINEEKSFITIQRANAADEKSSPLDVTLTELESLKEEVVQLNLLKSIISPIEFERKIQISQEIREKQNKIDQINFFLIEKKTKSANIFEDLFEQSFYGLKNTYDSLFSDEFTDYFTANGSKSKLNNSVNELIRTPAFKQWFGDWELAYLYKDFDNLEIPCSKVEFNGEPQLVWHGTGSEFSYFKFDTFPVAYFAVNEKYSQWFADLHGGGNGYTIPFFLNIRNPLDLTIFKTELVSPKDFFDYMFIKTGLTTDDLGINPLFLDPKMKPVETWVYIRNNPSMLQKLSESHVFDGIHFYETNPSVPFGEDAHMTEVWVAFRSNQIKLADPKRGEILLASLKSFLLEKGGVI